MIVVYAKHEPYWDTGHLADVISEMRLAGPPTIRVLEYKGKLFAVEGSHRLAAAHYLELIPKLIVLTPDSVGYDEFLERIIPTLPQYEFEYVLKLTEASFVNYA